MRKQSLMQGAVVLTTAALITKIIGFAASVILSRILGAEGIGLIMMVTPLMGLMMTITTLGLPTAISRLVAEAETEDNTKRVKQILLVSLTVTGSISVALVYVTLEWGQYFSSYFLADQRSYYALLAMVPVIPILAISGVVKGYFQGKQNMNPIAFSQIIEQIVRIACIYLFVQWLLPRGIEFAAAGAVLASVAGEAISLGNLLIMFKLNSGYRPRKIGPLHQLEAKRTLYDLLGTGLPTTGNSAFRSVIRVIQPIVITQSLSQLGMSAGVISEQYGMITGFVMPLLFLPGFVNYSLAVTLVPAISEANSRNDRNLIHRRIYQAIRISMLIGVPSTILLFLFSDQLLTIIYNAPEAAPLLKLMAPFFLFQYFHSPLQSCLVGIGRAASSMFNNILSKCVGLALIYPLSFHLELGIYGVAIAFSCGVIVETFLHFYAIGRHIGFNLNLSELSKILLAGVFMAIGAHIVYSWIPHTGTNLSIVATIVAIIVSLILYGVSILASKVVKRRDLARWREFR